MKILNENLRVFPRKFKFWKILRLPGVFFIALLYLHRQTVIGISESETLAVELKELLAVMFIIAGYMIRFWANGYRKGFENYSTVSFVSCGPYAHLRHPLYLGNMMIIIGFLLNCFSGIMIYISSTLTIIVFYLITVMEENKLLSALGAPYQEYLNRVPRRFIPRIKTSSPISTIPFRLNAAVTEMIKMTIVLLFFIGVDRLID
jgi:protein-S-isoprenylcysteine O-methyltransferase Ste14